MNQDYLDRVMDRVWIAFSIAIQKMNPFTLSLFNTTNRTTLGFIVQLRVGHVLKMDDLLVHLIVIFNFTR